MERCRLPFLTRESLVVQLILFLLLIFIIVQVRGSEVQPFIYLQF